MSAPAEPADRYVVTNPDRIPVELRERKEWLVARVTENGKPPLAPNGGDSWNDTSQSLLEFDDAYELTCEIAQSGRIDTDAGERVALAYRLTAGDPYTGIDIDDIEDITLVSGLIEKFSTGYIEKSVSENAHIIVRASIPEVTGGKYSLSDVDGATVELYDRNRYLVFTGDVVRSALPIGDGQEEMDALVDELTAKNQSRRRTHSSPTRGGPKQTSSITDIGKRSARWYAQGSTRSSTDRPTADEVVATAREYDHGFDSLWRGQTSGYETQSNADMALATKLAFWCKGDESLMDECFRQSDFYGCRGQEIPKWDAVRKSSGDTYGDLTLREARRLNAGRYQGSYLRQ
ncbi:hypothetical protein NDI76_11575 [Halogeometricum sp. S1BR25-6]|uniref:NrS-1 polymerase-like HBD domain-containing protein n=1 Tax=Halogeometricum salsisoli TaxID=2950536 RepID=A0ABU2GF18_9EURY|nr:hypothetical protein [Halogeometricum sp. S1BR25-6]MDS0299382.1 hypothetical protein [Halogeometricum sp. S1BR25-6]